MAKKDFNFYPSKKPTADIWCKPASEVFNNYEPKFKKKLLPLVSFDLGHINDSWKGTEAHVIHQNVWVDWLKFRIENNKYTFLESADKLSDIEELSEIDKKKGYLKTDADQKWSHDRTLHYNEAGLLIRKDPTSHYAKPMTYQWEDSPIGPRLISITTHRNEMDVAVERNVMEYDKDGFLSGFKNYNIGRHLILKDEFTYTTDKDGNQLIKNSDPDEPDIVIIKSDEKTILKRGKNYTYTLNKEESTKEIIDKTIIEVAKRAPFPSDKNLEGEIITQTVDVSEDGVLRSITYDYSSEEKLLNTVGVEHEDLDNGGFSANYFWGKEKSDYKFVFTPTATGFSMQQFKNGEPTNDRIVYIKNVTKQQAILSMKVYEEEIFFMSKTDLEPESIKKQGRSYALQLEFEGYKSGKVKKMIVNEARSEVSERAEISSARPIPWMQDDATPLDSKGEKMAYVCMFSSPELFGYYYLFYAAEENLIVQVFQCS